MTFGLRVGTYTSPGDLEDLDNCVVLFSLKNNPIVPSPQSPSVLVSLKLLDVRIEFLSTKLPDCILDLPLSLLLKLP